jgi:signal transduction histidine kinase
LQCASATADAAMLKLADSIRSSADGGMLFLQALLEQQHHQADGAQIEPLPVRQLLYDVVHLMDDSARAKSISLELIAHETVIVSGLRVGVAHVLQNLISNAIKYSPPTSQVTINAFNRGTRGRIQVMDRGPGISQDDQDRLFQRFVRLSSVPTAGESSTGLGLALAKQQSRAMGGDLWFEERDGGGSIFTLELPLA